MLPKNQSQAGMSPAEIIAVLNRSYRTTRESSSRETRDAAQKAFNNCVKWLRGRRIPFHQTPAGVWVLDKVEEEASGTNQTQTST